MITNYRQPKFLTNHHSKLLIDRCRHPKDRLLILIMLDCGLRVSELVTLKLAHFNFKDHVVHVRSLKKRDKEEFRAIPLTRRLIRALSEYYVGLADKNPQAFLFPSSNKRSSTGHISRITVWRRIRKHSNNVIYPHVLRHTFATRIVSEGNSLIAAKELLGHASTRTTEIYTHLSDEHRIKAIQSIERRPLATRMRDRFFPSRNVFILDHTSRLTGIHVGRKEELTTLLDLHNRKINALLLGPQGVGKSHLVDQLPNNHILRLDDFKSVKKTLVALALNLFKGDKEAAFEMLYEKADQQKVIMKESAKRLTELLLEVTEKDEYTIAIDDITHITKTGVDVLEKLKNHFHIVACARQVKVQFGTALTNFDKIQIKPLKRIEAIELIDRLSIPIMQRIEDYECYKNHIHEQTAGNPLFITELIDRYRKEPELNTAHIRAITHTTALKEIDMSLFVIIALSSLMVLRYVGGELDSNSGAFRLLGGAFLLFALFARNIYTQTKRKFI